MRILAIDTSCDETSVAVTKGRRVLSYGNYSQVLIHTQWGGVVPSLAKRAHEERIDWMVEEVIDKFNRLNVILGRPDLIGTTPESQPKTDSGQARMTTIMDNIDYIAVTQGPGLAIALEVGIRKAKELSAKYNKPLIAVNHMEGHIYSCFVQNSKGNPKIDFIFPYLALLVSGSHTELVLFKDHISYEILGETLDDAAGEAIDKASRMLGFGYPGGPVLERLASSGGNKDEYTLPRPMSKSKTLEFSFSGLKTAFFYSLKKMSDDEKNKQLKYLASSFQEAVFESLLAKTELAMKKTKVINIVVGGGVSANKRLRTLLRSLVKKYKGSVIFPPYQYLTGDNAAMIGVAAYYKAKKKLIVSSPESLDRVPRLRLA